MHAQGRSQLDVRYHSRLFWAGETQERNAISVQFVCNDILSRTATASICSKGHRAPVSGPLLTITF